MTNNVVPFAAPSFQAELLGLRIAEVLRSVGRPDADEGRRALTRAPLSLEDAAILLRCPSEPILDDVVERARALTQERHGRSIALHAPCYMSSFCLNECAYCDRPAAGQIPRVWHSPIRVRNEAMHLARHGLTRILLVAGEAPAIVTPDSIADTIAAVRPIVPDVDVLAGPAEVSDYRLWKEAGASGIVGYQETYDHGIYTVVHPHGPKARYGDRMAAPERAGEAGIARLGIGILLGLGEPALELLTLISHARFLERRYPASRVVLGIPRAVPRASFAPPFRVDDIEVLRAYAVLRLALPEAGLTVTTREPEWLRGRLLACATEMSVRPPALEETYIECAHDGGALEILDPRSAEEVQWEVEDLGYTVPRACFRSK